MTTEYLESQGYLIFYNYFNEMLHSEEKSMRRTVSIIEKSEHYKVLLRLIDALLARLVKIGSEFS